MQCVSSCSLNCTEHFIYVLKTRHLVVIDISFNCIQHFSNLKIHNNKGFSYKGESKFKLEYLISIYSYRTCWLSVVMLVREFIICFQSPFLEKVFFSTFAFT